MPTPTPTPTPPPATTTTAATLTANTNRRNRGRKRKRTDLAEGEEEGGYAGLIECEDGGGGGDEKRKRKRKKRGGKKVGEEKVGEEGLDGGGGGGGGGGEGEKKKKKRRRRKKKGGDKGNVEVEGGEKEGEKEGGGKKHRFIVFIGNLPFNTTTTSLSTHFASVHPTSIRLATTRTPNTTTTTTTTTSSSNNKPAATCRGFAFLEFEAYDRMKSCLSRFHHSLFGEEGRKINVELTAGGGGGKSQARKSKLEEKNTRLNEQRWRRAAEEAKSKNEKIQKRLELEGAGEEKNKIKADDAIHPSRRGLVK